MKDYYFIIELIIIVGVILGWVFVHEMGSDFFFLALGLIGIGAVEAARGVI